MFASKRTDQGCEGRPIAERRFKAAREVGALGRLTCSLTCRSAIVQHPQHPIRLSSVAHASFSHGVTSSLSRSVVGKSLCMLLWTSHWYF